MKLLSTVMAFGLCVPFASAQDALTVSLMNGQDTRTGYAAGRGADVRVRVVDRDQKPVEGATVSAILPAMGVGGHFRGGTTVATTQTDSQGQAEFTGIHLRGLTGDFTTRVLARSGDRTGSASLVQKVSAGTAPPQQGWMSRRRLVILGVAAAGIAAGVVAATYGGESSTPAIGLTVTPGIPVTTGPR